jgi:hypothetical protein
MMRRFSAFPETDFDLAVENGGVYDGPRNWYSKSPICVENSVEAGNEQTDPSGILVLVSRWTEWEKRFVGLGTNVEGPRKVGQIADFVDTNRRRRFAGGMGDTAGFVGGNRLGRDEAVVRAVAVVVAAAVTAVVPEERTAPVWFACVVGYRWIGLPL